jgi:hypothetical protein
MGRVTTDVRSLCSIASMRRAHGIHIDDKRSMNARPSARSSKEVTRRDGRNELIHATSAACSCLDIVRVPNIPAWDQSAQVSCEERTRRGLLSVGNGVA